MSCNLGKPRTRFTVNSLVFVILFWFLVENFKLSARTKDARDTRDAFLESVYPCIADMRELDRRSREIFTANGARHIAESTALMYIPIEDGGKGFKSIGDTF